MCEERAGTRVVAPETARIAAAVGSFRRMHMLTRREVARALRTPADRIALYEAGAAGVPTAYAGGLVKMCGAEPHHLLTMLFRPHDGPAEPAPLPASPTVMELTLRLWRHEPAAAPQARELLARKLAAAPNPRRSALLRMGDPFGARKRLTPGRV